MFVSRYLLPCTHVMLSQRRAVRETDLYGKSADKFLSLIPECCRITAAPSSERDDEPAFWGKGKTVSGTFTDVRLNCAEKNFAAVHVRVYVY